MRLPLSNFFVSSDDDIDHDNDEMNECKITNDE